MTSTGAGLVGNLSNTAYQTGAAATRGDVKGTAKGLAKGTGQTVAGAGKGVDDTVSGLGKGVNNTVWLPCQGVLTLCERILRG